MKKNILYIICAICAMCVTTACDSDSIDGLSGMYNNISFCDFTNATVQPTDKLGKGVKALNTSYTDGAGNTLTLRFGSKEWVLGEGTYLQVDNVTTAGTYSGSVNGAAITYGNVDVNKIGDVYYISALVKTGDGKEYRTNFKGAMQFIVGEDDPEPSGYTMSIQTSAVEIMDWTTWQSTVYPDVTKYSVTVSDPNGKQVAYFDMISGNNLKPEQLAGTYTIVSDAHDPMQISAGYSLPEYSMAGGSGYMDASGNMQYLVGGSIELTTVTGIDGSTLYTFKGAGLSIIDVAGNTATNGALNIMFVSIPM